MIERVLSKLIRGTKRQVEGRHLDPEQKPRLLAALAPLALAICLAGLLMVAMWAAALAALPGSEQPVYPFHYEDALPDVAANASGDYLALAWSRGRHSESGPAGYAYLDIAQVAEGKWQRVLKVYPASATEIESARLARIVFDPSQSTKLHMVWEHKSGVAFNEVQYALCDVAVEGDCGVSQINRSKVVDAFASNGPNQPDIAVDEGGRRHVVWVTTNGRVEYRCSTNGGSWSPTTPILVRAALTATQPSIAYANGKVHVVWAEGPADFDKIGYKNAAVSSGCPSGPASFVNPAIFNVANSAYTARNPRVAAAGDTVYVVWNVRTNQSIGTNVYTYHLVYNRSTDGGVSWERDPTGSPPEYLNITTGGTTFTGRPGYEGRPDYNYDYGEWLHPDVTLEVTGSNTIAHVVWQQSTVTWSGNPGEEIDQAYYDIFYSTHDGTGAWDTPTNVTAGTQGGLEIYSVMPSLAVDNQGQVHIAYMKEKGNGWNSPEDWDAYYFGVLEGPPQGGVYLPIVLKKS